MQVRQGLDDVAQVGSNAERSPRTNASELVPGAPEAMRSLEEFAAIRDAVDVPILANMTEFGKSDLFSVDQLRDVGVNIVIWPVSLLRIAMGAAGRALDTLNEEGHLTSKLGEMQHRADLYDLIDYESYNHFDSGVFNFTIAKD